MDKIVHTLTAKEAEDKVYSLADIVRCASDTLEKSGSYNIVGLWCEFKDILNELLHDFNMRCTSIRMSNNTDKKEFDVYVLPQLSNDTIERIICGNYDIDCPKIIDFSLDIDSKMLMVYDPPEVVSMIVADIQAMANIHIYDILQFAINAYICNSGKAAAGYIIPCEELWSSGWKMNVVKYAMVSFLRRMYCVCDSDPIHATWTTPLMQVAGMCDICNNIHRDRITHLRGGYETDSNVAMSVFEWAFSIIDNPELHLCDAINTLSAIRDTTGSELEANWIKSIINSIRVGTNTDGNCNNMRESAVLNEGFSLFKSLKINGLRGIEDDLYEYIIRIKNCEEEEDAMFILRQINTRLTILDDYLRNTDKISDSERERWQGCINSYRELRAQLGQKKIGGKKQYGIFIDYDKLDQMYG